MRESRIPNHKIPIGYPIIPKFCKKEENFIYVQRDLPFHVGIRAVKETLLLMPLKDFQSSQNPICLCKLKLVADDNTNSLYYVSICGERDRERER